ncbi:PAS domain S-box protein [Halonotius terrestris]|uniref:histidine kinase n=1 Tax=Halonotius terrestris TaxID=2487750 RepID=A0A8J8PC92_9EURY|nr:HAMP domain-containing sensor histidine kinase [Halonotius terrestris]TQQ82552.1 PAS domain S-box protein [Halonotius terrestris]
MKENQHEFESDRAFIEAGLNTITDIFYVVDTEGNFQRWNDKLPDLTGYTDAEIDSMNALEFFEGEHRESIEAAIENILQTGSDVTEAEITTKDGRDIPHEFRGVTMTDDAGTPTGIIGIARDITARKQREQDLRNLHTRFELALAETDTGIWELDLDSNTVRWDTTSERLFGYEPGEYPGTYAGVGSRATEHDSEPGAAESDPDTETDAQYRPDYDDRIPSEDLDRVSQQLDHAIETGEQYQADFRVQQPDGAQRWIRARGVVEYDDSGNPDRVIGIQTDITEGKERERELERTKETLQRKNERLNEFASMISHDLRNPLEIAEGYLEKARETDDEADLDTVEAALDRMGTMIDDFLTLARAETVDPETEPVVLADIVVTTWETTQTDEAILECEIPESMTVAADKSLLRNVLENCFRNAVEHNDSRVTISVGQLDNRGFYIEDTGGGIPESEQDTVFEHGYTTNESGTGLGLAIIRELIEAHGWTISVSESAAGGARFEIVTDGS